MEVPIQNSFEELSFEKLIKEDNKIQKEEKQTLEQKLSEIRKKWSEKIKEMSLLLKKIFDVQVLMINIYTKRQIALEYYHNIISLLTKINKNYRKQYSQKYNYYTFKSQQRFPNEKVKENQILSEMEDIISKKEALNNHAKFMAETIKTIDSIIYGMKYRIDIEQISRGK